MGTIQLELFDKKPQLITKMKILKNWVLVDNRDRDIEMSVKLKHHYPLVINLEDGKLCDSTFGESRILPTDIYAKKIDIIHYLQVSNLLRLKKKIYNKKKFQLEIKK
jgi:hypothetical protein